MAHTLTVRKPTAAWPLVLLAILFAGFATGLTMYLQMRPAPLPTLFDAPAFEMTSQFDETVRSEKLRGNVWVANFIFTNCAGPCSKMTAKMQELTKSLESRRMRFVSISVDPTRDTPAVLKSYGEKFQADPARWLFLTAPGTDYVKLAQEFRVLAAPADGEHPIFHSEKFFLVDAAGKVRGIYSPNSDPELTQLVHDAGRLLGE